jgi:LmbE family N-acetylglucosaminyl deacetylase
MNPYLSFVEQVVALQQHARQLPTPTDREQPSEAPHQAMLFSPHPDDECITGLLPLRLMREANCRITNVPITFGSNQERQAARASELEAACAFLGWGIHRVREDYRSLSAEEVASTIRDLSPDIVVCPHAADWNSRHISTHHMVMDALAMQDDSYACLVVETEFWGAMDDPNLMVEGNAQLVADLVAATSLHVGEVARNPYHLLLPAWMLDNVRRGGELVGGQGAEAPDFTFATLYRIRRWHNKALHHLSNTPVHLPVNTPSLKEIISWK